MLLCDFCEAVNGKLYIMGGGWSVTGPQPMPFGIAILIQVPWDQANRRHEFRFELVTSDGEPVKVSSPDGEQPLVAQGEFEVGRPPGVKPGTPLDFPIAFNSGPQPFPPGSRFEWRLTVNGQTHEDWRLAFSTRPVAGEAVAADVGANPEP